VFDFLSDSTLLAPLSQAEHLSPFLKSGRRQDQLLVKYIMVTVFVFSNFFCNDKRCLSTQAFVST